MATKNEKVTKAQIDAWKKKYGNRLRKFELEADGKKHVAFFQKPKLEFVQAAEAEHPGDMIERNLFLFNQCYIAGDQVFQDEDEYRFALANGIGRSFRILTGEVKNV